MINDFHKNARGIDVFGLFKFDLPILLNNEKKYGNKSQLLPIIEIIVLPATA